jgi:hypothetical protein
MQYPRKYQVKKVMKFQVLKVESANSTMSGSHFSWLIYDSSNNVNYVEWCLQKGRPRYCWQNQICYCKKSINVKVLFFLIKVWNMKNVSIWFQQKPIPQLCMFCLIQGINNYVQINIYWSYTVRICIFINLSLTQPAPPLPLDPQLLILFIRALQFIPAPTCPWLVRKHFLLANKSMLLARLIKIQIRTV